MRWLLLCATALLCTGCLLPPAEYGERPFGKIIQVATYWHPWGSSSRVRGGDPPTPKEETPMDEKIQSPPDLVVNL
jgi:hypothetical protein